MKIEEFSDAIIARSYSRDEEQSYIHGYLACVFPNGYAGLSSYGNSDTVHPFFSICQGISYDESIREGTPDWQWYGTIDELVSLAFHKKDPCMPERIASSLDSDYDLLIEVYSQILDYFQNQTKEDFPYVK